MVGGFSNQRTLDSIEVLNIKAESQSWQLFQGQALSPRQGPLVGAIGPHHLLILGGYASGFLTDGVVMDTRDRSVIKVIKTEHGFACYCEA